MVSIREEGFVTVEMKKKGLSYRVDNFKNSTFVTKTRVVHKDNVLKCYCVVKTYHKGKLDSINSAIQYFDENINVVKSLRK